MTVALLVTAQPAIHALHRDMYQLQQQILELVPDRFAPGAKQIIVGYVDRIFASVKSANYSSRVRW